MEWGIIQHFCAQLNYWLSYKNIVRKSVVSKTKIQNFYNCNKEVLIFLVCSLKINYSTVAVNSIYAIAQKSAVKRVIVI